MKISHGDKSVTSMPAVCNGDDHARRGGEIALYVDLSITERGW